MKEPSSSLYKATLAVTSSLDEGEVLDRIMEEASSVLPSVSVNVCLFEKNHIRLVRYRPHPNHPCDPAIVEEIYNLPNLENVRKLRNQRKSILIADTWSDDQWVYHEYTRWIRSFLSLPLIFHNETIGMLNFDGDEPSVVTEEDVHRLEAYAHAASIALHNARLVERYQQSIREKEELLREVYHRVNNNLNVITSLLSLQLEQVTDRTDPRGALVQIRDRIYSISLVHESLFESSNISAVDMNEYARSLLGWLISNHKTGYHIHSHFHSEPVELSIQQSVPCGLLLNELISNSLTHAFTEKPDGELYVAVARQSNSTITVEVYDNGVGIPPEVDPYKPTTLGLQMIHILVDQLNGSIYISDRSEAGTRIIVSFPPLLSETLYVSIP